MWSTVLLSTILGKKQAVCILLDSVIEEMLVGMAWRFQDKADFGDAPEPSKAMTPMAPMAPFERVGSNPAEPLRFVAWLSLSTSKTHISTGQFADQRLFMIIPVKSRTPNIQQCYQFQWRATAPPIFEDASHIVLSRILWTFVDFSANGISTGHMSSVPCQGRSLTQPTQHLD